MKNHIEKGQKLLYTALVGVIAGDPVVIGSRLGVADTNIGTGETGVLSMEGVFSLPKSTGAISQGADCYFDVDGAPVDASNAGAITITASGNVAAGYAFAAAGSADTHVKVKLRG